MKLKDKLIKWFKENWLIILVFILTLFLITRLNVPS